MSKEAAMFQAGDLVAYSQSTGHDLLREDLRLPSDFVWGTATAAVQIEGGISQDGKGKSIWDVYTHLEPSRTNGENADVACDHYNRVAEDVELMSSLGVDVYRFSLAWTRIIPLGGRNDPINEKGVAFYDDLINRLLANNIEPVVTLYHWDLPQELYERYKGLLDTAEYRADFQNYARICFSRFGDRVKKWVTFNEPYIISIFAHHSGVLAPGRCAASGANTKTEPWRVGHTIILSHASVVQVYAEEFQPSQKGEISIVLNGHFYEPFDEGNQTDVEAAQRRMEFYIGWFGDPVFLGTDYPSSMRAYLGSRLPEFTAEERALLRKTAPINAFYGMNHYSTKYARALPDPPADDDWTGNIEETSVNKQGVEIGPMSGVQWLRLAPEGFRKLLNWVWNRYQLPIIVTENGCPCPGEIDVDVARKDHFRQRYFGFYLDAISRSIYEDGVRVEGYYAWSLMDNFGCIAKAVGDFQAGDFTPDGKNVIVNVVFTGAPTAPNPASIYDGEHVLLIKADGTNFTNGDPWKCLSCGVPAVNAISLDPQKDYPHVFRSGDKALWGHNILDCGGAPLESDACTPNKTYIYPIHWNTAADGSGKGGSPREMRLHPDDVHMGWSSFTSTGGQFAYTGRLNFNAERTVGETLAPRYDLVDVNLLFDPTRANPITTNGSELIIHNNAIAVGELRGFSGNGEEITYIGNPVESTNIDVFAVHVQTGAVRRLTSHPEYVDPMAFSADNDWFVAMDTRGTNRQMWMSGMRGIPPLIDLVAVTVAASTRNNGPRRFFQTILIDRYGDRGDYYGQRINAAGVESGGAINDPNWNGRADPAFSLDGTKITYWQALVVSPSCGGANPLPCPESTAQGGREYRVMLAQRIGREATAPAPIYKIPDVIPWATPFPPGTAIPESPFTVEPGNYTLRGKVSGIAGVSIAPDSTNVSGLGSVAVNYTNYSDDGEHILNGFEDVTVKILLPNFWTNQVDWVSDIVQTGVVNGTKKTSEGGFHLIIDAELNLFNASGTLVTTIDGVEYKQPANGT
ncbi:hypothetical protein CABS01_02446 [Colletotrichum abscissum]|uniref:uncharacterized protein n=1 Tax=Colletotrichum abscissum TaxID=1671311 RepID=UPI0027D55541|nr:uncharacterized protein CABS01_02446 [Colletotrichum abscissum]KAK1488816.1 hypothetical protein CABS01_02446 [Colletotrichum abscissum]